MSFFQDKAEYLLKGDDQLDVFHLGAHGCDVMFSHYEKGKRTEGIINRLSSRYLIIQGSLLLTVDGNSQELATGDWFEIQKQTEHDLTYLTDCSLIEFWFSERKHQ